MRRRTIFNIFITVGILLMVTSGAIAQSREEVREEFRQVYPLATDGRVKLDNINGSVRILVWDRDEVKVDAVKRARTRERLAEAEIKVDVSQDEIRIKTRYPNNTNNNNPASVDYTLTVPRNLRLAGIELINGSIEMEGLQGNVKASSINGRIQARALKGEAKLSTINGTIEAVFEQLNESLPVSLESINGSIVLIIPSDASAQLKASTVHGAISNDFGLPVRKGEFVGRDLSGRLGDGNTLIRLSNVNGSVKIRRASDGRPLSPAINLLPDTKSETKSKFKHKRSEDRDHDSDEDQE
jgi:DUF4097 and DUF4098 domain-containing protein YvlB